MADLSALVGFPGGERYTKFEARYQFCSLEWVPYEDLAEGVNVTNLSKSPAADNDEVAYVAIIVFATNEGELPVFFKDSSDPNAVNLYAKILYQLGMKGWSMAGNPDVTDTTQITFLQRKVNY